MRRSFFSRKFKSDGYSSVQEVKKAAVAKRSGRKSKRTSFALYISKVLKGASKSKLTLSSKSVKILDSLVQVL
jgi:hypothetical protein